MFDAFDTGPASESLPHQKLDNKILQRKLKQTQEVYISLIITAV